MKNPLRYTPLALLPHRVMSLTKVKVHCIFTECYASEVLIYSRVCGYVWLVSGSTKEACWRRLTAMARRSRRQGAIGGT